MGAWCTTAVCPCCKTQEVSPQFTFALAFVAAISTFFSPQFLALLSKLQSYPIIAIFVHCLAQLGPFLIGF